MKHKHNNYIVKFTGAGVMSKVTALAYRDRRDEAG